MLAALLPVSGLDTQGFGSACLQLGWAERLGSKHLGCWIRYVSNPVSHALAAKMAKEGVSVAEWAMLGELQSTRTTVPDRLAVNLGLTPGTISKLSDGLTDKGLIVRQENPTDGRTHTLALTSEGQRLVPLQAEIADRHDDEGFGHWSKEEREMFIRFLTLSVRVPLPKSPGVGPALNGLQRNTPKTP